MGIYTGRFSQTHSERISDWSPKPSRGPGVPWGIMMGRGRGRSCLGHQLNRDVLIRESLGAEAGLQRLQPRGRLRLGAELLRQAAARRQPLARLPLLRLPRCQLHQPRARV